MINRKELAICKKRGHDPVGHGDKWERCKHCGTWTRTLRTVQERENDPPEKQQGTAHQLERMAKMLDRPGPLGEPKKKAGK